MNILVSNDDGIESIGLIKLVKALSTIGNVYVCAPEAQRSAYSHHFTIKGRMKLEERQVEGAVKAYALWGTPVDCVHCAEQFLFKDINFDLVVSGINTGWNVSSDAAYSGTVAAAREGFMQGIPAIAMSLDTFEKTDKYDYPAKVACEIALKYLEDENKYDYFLNVNVPFVDESEIKGIRVCDGMGFVDYTEDYYIIEEDNERYIALGEGHSVVNVDKNDPRIDINALKENYISLSPYHFDQAKHEYIELVKRKYEKN